MNKIAYRVYINLRNRTYKVPDINFTGIIPAELDFEEIFDYIKDEASVYIKSEYYNKNILPPARDSSNEKKPASAICSYIVIDTELMKPAEMSLAEMDEIEKTRVYNLMVSNDNVLEWNKTSNIITFTLCQKKYINKVKKIAGKNPENAKIIYENDDGCVFGKMKRACLRIQTPQTGRELTDEEYNKLVIRLADARERR